MTRTDRLSDKAVLMLAARDQRNLAILVKRYRAPLYNFVFRFVGDRETAEDIVQETFLRCLRHRHQYPAITVNDLVSRVMRIVLRRSV